jgi:hypothetical protein
MKGTEKQIEWSSKIRGDVIYARKRDLEITADCDKNSFTDVDVYETEKRKRKVLIYEKIIAIDDAKFWIDNRFDLTINKVLNGSLDNIYKELIKKKVFEYEKELDLDFDAIADEVENG